jgi:hypothetical protein
MATVRDIIQRSYRRLLVNAAGETMSASDASVALDALNDMFYTWAANGCDTLHQGFTLTDTFVFWVPPAVIDPTTSAPATATTVADSVTYAGTWNASTNTPTLASSTGTTGAVYRVSVAGSTVLDSLTSYSVDDFIVFNGSTWLKGRNSNRHTQTAVALLAVRMAGDFGMEVPRQVAIDADTGWDTMLADYVHVPDAAFDRALSRLPSRRWPYSVPSSELT